MAKKLKPGRLKTMRKRDEQSGISATDSALRPADFPLDSVESRSAVRAMINRRAAQDQKAATIYRASWVGRPNDEDFEIGDLETGLRESGEKPASGSQPDTVVGGVGEQDRP